MLCCKPLMSGPEKSNRSGRVQMGGIKPCFSCELHAWPDCSDEAPSLSAALFKACSSSVSLLSAFSLCCAVSSSHLCTISVDWRLRYVTSTWHFVKLNFAPQSVHHKSAVDILSKMFKALTFQIPHLNQIKDSQAYSAVAEIRCILVHDPSHCVLFSEERRFVPLTRIEEGADKKLSMKRCNKGP